MSIELAINKFNVRDSNGDYHAIDAIDASGASDSKMERYVIRLVKNADNTYKMTSLDDVDLTFDEVYNVTRDLSKYVVIVYGSSKLRPQYVSTNEIMFVGLDRSTESKILRVHYTPTRLTYETFRLAEYDDLDAVESSLSESIAEISDALFKRTDASPNVYDMSKAEDGKYIATNGNVSASASQRLSAPIFLPDGCKLVLTRGDSRQAITYRTLQNFAVAMLWDLENNPILSSRATSVSEITNATGHDCYCRFNYQYTNENYILQMAEIMDADTPTSEAIGLTKYYEYYEAQFGEKVKKSAIETESKFYTTGEYPVNGKAIADAIKSPLFDKKILFLGDSFTNSSSDTDYRYRHYIAQRTGCMHVNYGVSGSQITYRPTATIESFPARAERMTEDCDMIVIFGGINDCRAFQKDITAFNKYYIIGTDEDVFDWDAEVNSLKACLKHVLDVLVAQYPTKSIVALLPPVLNPKSDDYSQMVNTICNAEIDIYEKYGIPYFDLRTESKISGCDAHISLYNMAEDNVHWNANGHLRASWGIQKFLEREII